MRHLATRNETAGLIRVSLPAGLQQLFFAAGLVAMFVIIGKIGTPELAAANVLITVLLFAILPGLAAGYRLHDFGWSSAWERPTGRCLPLGVGRWQGHCHTIDGTWNSHVANSRFGVEHFYSRSCDP